MSYTIIVRTTKGLLVSMQVYLQSLSWEIHLIIVLSLCTSCHLCCMQLLICAAVSATVSVDRFVPLLLT